MINFKHLAQVEESYIAHCKFGLWAGIVLIVLGIVSIIHAIFPFLFVRKPDKIYKYFVAKSQARITQVDQILKSKNLE
jgi:hypothetical protein